MSDSHPSEWLERRYRRMMKHQYGASDDELLEPHFDQGSLDKLGSVIEASTEAFELLRRGRQISILASSCLSGCFSKPPYVAITAC
jgi:hypothetical protein